MDMARPSDTRPKSCRASRLIDVVTPDQPFTAVDFQRLAARAIDDVHARGKLPLVVGGTGS